MTTRRIMKHLAYISIGSNLGDRVANCEAGINFLCNCNDTNLVARSGYYRTDPVGYEDQPWFVNAALCVETTLDPPSLLSRLKQIEWRAGRIPAQIRFGPRILDMDILLYDQVCLSIPGLEIPHPRMHERRFVLEPLCEIAPGLVHPVLQKNMAELLAAPGVMSQGCMPYEDVECFKEGIEMN